LAITCALATCPRPRPCATLPCAAGANPLLPLFYNTNPAIWLMFGSEPEDKFCNFDNDFGDDRATAVAACVAETLVIWVNVLILQVILVNLLIAMMSGTYTDESARADIDSKAERVKRTLDYIRHYHPVPPPINTPILLVLIPVWAVQSMIHACSGRWGGNDASSPPPSRDWLISRQMLVEIGTPHKMRDDVLLLSEIRKDQGEFRAASGSSPGVGHERMSDAERHVQMLRSIEAVRKEVGQVSTRIDVMQLALQSAAEARGSGSPSPMDARRRPSILDQTPAAQQSAVPRRAACSARVPS